MVQLRASLKTLVNHGNMVPRSLKKAVAYITGVGPYLLRIKFRVSIKRNPENPCKSRQYDAEEFKGSSPLAVS